MPLNFLNTGYFAEKVGIGINSPVAVLDVFGSGVQNGSLPGIKLSSSNTQQTVFAIGNTGTRQYEIAVGGTTSSVPGSFYIYDNNQGKFRLILSTAGNFSIGETLPTQKLQLGDHGSLIDSIRIGTYEVAKNTRQYIGYTRDDSGLFETASSGNSPSTVLSGVAGIRIVNTQGTLASDKADNSVQLLTHIYNGGSRVALHASYNGDIGIGTTDPITKLEIKGTASTRNALSNVLTINGGENVSNPYDGFGVGTVFRGRDYSNALRDYAYIYGVIQNQTSSSTPAGDPGFKSQLRFYTNTGGASATLPTQKMVINSAGDVGIGETNPKAPGGTAARTLTLKGTNFPQFISVASNATANSTTWRSIARNNLVYQIQTVNDAITTEQNAYEIKRTAGSNAIEYQRWYGGTTEAMRITSAGAIKFNAYGAGILVSDASGNITATTSPPVDGITFNNGATITNQINTDVDTGTEAIASVVLATHDSAFFDFVIKKGLNVRSGTVYACHDGGSPTTLVAFTETSTQDLGDTSDVTLNVVISTIYLQLQATTTSDGWSIKSLIRAI